MDAAAMQLRIHRLSLMLGELPRADLPLVMLGIQPRGVYLAERLKAAWTQQMPGVALDYGLLDPTFFRDDFNQDKVLVPEATQLNFSLGFCDRDRSIPNARREPVRACRGWHAWGRP